MAHKASVSSRDVYKISSCKFNSLRCSELMLHYTQVSLGVIPNNENKREDMLFIIDDLHRYVPCVPYQVSRINRKGDTVIEERAQFHKILVGGDQLTSARMRSAIKMKVNSQTDCKRLCGIIPVVEDWHTKVNFLRVSINNINTTGVLCFLYTFISLCGNTTTVINLLDNMVHCISSATF